LVLRGHDRQACFFEDMDRHVFLGYLGEAAETTECDLHAYVLMSNHMHFLVTSRAARGLSRLMHHSARRYSAYVNRRRRRSGSLYEGRFRSCPIRSDRYFLSCMRYIETNPVRAGMCASAGDYKWSSYRANSSGAPTGLITPHPVYQGLGHSREARAAAYVGLFLDPPDDAMLRRFREGLAPRPRGRPRKTGEPAEEINLVLF
jgi:putative transposase